MRTIRRCRIGPREAEHLFSVDRAGSEHGELSFLLAAAAAPSRPDELVGHELPVAAFEQAGREAGAPVRRSHARGRRFTRSVAVKAVAVATATLIGGTAYAAETGRLPDAAQWQAHDVFFPLGVPAPRDASPNVADPVPRPTPDGGGRTLDPSSPAVLGLCRAWQAVQGNPNGKPMSAESFQDLAEAAGGERDIAAFCAPLPTEYPGRAPALPTPPPETATPPPIPSGGGKGHGRPTAVPNQKG